MQRNQRKENRHSNTEPFRFQQRHDQDADKVRDRNNRKNRKQGKNQKIIHEKTVFEHRTQFLYSVRQNVKETEGSNGVSASF